MAPVRCPVNGKIHLLRQLAFILGLTLLSEHPTKIPTTFQLKVRALQFHAIAFRMFDSANTSAHPASNTAALDGELQKRYLTPQTKSEILQRLWPPSGISGTGDSNLDWEPYFKYYQAQCEDALHEQGKHVVVRKHQHIIDIGCQLGRGQPRDEIKAGLKVLFTTDEERPDEDEILDNSVDLAARLCLMVDIGAYKSTVTQGTRFSWNIPSLKDFLRTCFPTTQKIKDRNIRFEKAFTAFTIERIAGIEICWTNNLADHLLMVNDDERRIAIFHHASFLKRQRNNPLFPTGLVDETLCTLALLFNKDDKQTKKWLKSLPASLPVDQSLLGLKRLRFDDRQIGKFKFWHDRLIVLKLSFDESRPSRLSQWWYDDRDGHSWYTFWVAVLVLFLTIFFGLVQSIEGGLQVYKAYYPANR
jgi:hypothetical protein